MKTKYHGDIPPKHLETLRDLEMLENWFDVNGRTISEVSAAKGMTCLAHDYYGIYFDEEGERILLRAEKICPGYFKAEIHKHIEKDPEFAKLVKQLKDTLALEMLVTLGYDE